MPSDDVRYSLVVLLFGVAGAAIWAYTSHEQLKHLRFSLRAMFWLTFAVATGITIGLWFIGAWHEFWRTMD